MLKRVLLTLLNAFIVLKIPLAFADCPATSILSPPDPTNNRYYWTAPEGWKSTFSFAKTVDHFKGAQWQGAIVGQIICIYISKDTDAFPITLQNGNLVNQPSGSSWQMVTTAANNIVVQQSQNRLMNCVSQTGQTSDCPYSDKTVTGDPNAAFYAADPSLAGQYKNYTIPTYAPPSTPQSSSDQQKQQALDALLLQTQQQLQQQQPSQP